MYWKAIQKINKLLTNYKGQKVLTFVVYDTAEKLKLTMPSRKIKVDISNEFLNELEQQHINFKLN